MVILIKIKILNKDNKNKDFCKTVKSSQEDKMLKFNQYMKSDKVPCIIQGDLKSLIKKEDRCANNPEISLTTEIGEHVPCRYLISTM